MARKHEKICTVCGKHYQYCNSCAKYASQPLWKSAFCSERCMKIFDISGRYNIGEYGKEQAKKLFDELGVSGDEKFASAGVTKSVERIYGEKNINNEIKEEESSAKDESKSKEKSDEAKEEKVSTKKTAEEKKVSEYVNATKRRSYKKNKE